MRPRGRAALVAALLVLAGACSDGNGSDEPAETTSTTTTTTEAGEDASGPACTRDERFDEGADHVESPRYEVDPPAGGPHLEQAAPAGAYRERPPDGNVVHSLEHGFIALWYLPSEEEGFQQAIIEVARRFPDSILVIPRASMDVPLAMTAWHHRLLCERPDVEAMVAFATERRDKGPETGFLPPRDG